jgi:hypothetical protein
VKARRNTEREERAQHIIEEKKQIPERIIRLKELGCGNQPSTGLEQLAWYCPDAQCIAMEYLNTHNEGDEAIEQMDKIGIAYKLWNGSTKPEEWWRRFGDELDNPDQTLGLIHRLAKIRKLVRERTRDNHNLVKIYHQLMQQAENAQCTHMGVKGIIPTSELWGGAVLERSTIQEREDQDEKVGKEIFVMKVQEEALKWAESEWKKTEEHTKDQEIEITEKMRTKLYTSKKSR